MNRSLLIFLLLVKATILALIGFGLSPDEAQYWSWSQDLDWGYFSKPPGIAWQIWLTTKIFGNNVFGIRFGAYLIGFLIPLAIYKLARNSNLEEKISLWAACIFAISPLGCYLSFAATTDGGAILFFVIAAAVVVKRQNYPLTGLPIMFGALYKWTAFAFWPFALIFYPRKKIVLAILISLIALVPSLYWNIDHDFATFRHVGGALGHKRHGNFFDFLGAQIALLSPIFFAFLLIGIFKRKNRALWFCASFAIAVLFYFVTACFKKVQPNWAAYLYPPAMVIIAWALYPRHKKWLYLGSAISIIMVAGAFIIPTTNLPYKLNPFRQLMGWKNLEKTLVEIGYNPQKDILFADKYQTASLLSFYSPEKKRAYFFNISETRKNQFSYWPQMEKGASGYFVVIENTHEEAIFWYETHYLKRLSPHFKDVSFVGAYPIYSVSGKPVKYVMLFRGDDYLDFFSFEESSKY